MSYIEVFYLYLPSITYIHTYAESKTTVNSNIKGLKFRKILVCIHVHLFLQPRAPGEHGRERDCLKNSYVYVHKVPGIYARINKECGERNTLVKSNFQKNTGVYTYVYAF